MCEQPEKEEMIGRGEKKKKKKLGQWRRNIYHKSFFFRCWDKYESQLWSFIYTSVNTEQALQLVLYVTKPTTRVL